MVTQRHGQTAFTLIELMVTLAILAILATLAAPSFSSYIANQRVKSAAYDLIATLNYARSEATKRNADVAITAEASSWSKGWAITGDGDTLQSYAPESRITIAESNSQTSITYEGNGRISNAARPVLTICDPDSSAEVTRRIIEIDLTGRPNLKRNGTCNV